MLLRPVFVRIYVASEMEENPDVLFVRWQKYLYPYAFLKVESSWEKTTSSSRKKDHIAVMLIRFSMTQHDQIQHDQNKGNLFYQPFCSVITANTNKSMVLTPKR